MKRVFRFRTGEGFHFANAFGERFGMLVQNDRVTLSEDFGAGFIQEVALPNGFALCLHSYTLKEPFVLERLDAGADNLVTIKFDCRRITTDNKKTYTNPLFSNEYKCEVGLGTSNFFTKVSLPAYQHINFAVIVTSRENLLAHLNFNGQSEGLRDVMVGSPSFLFHEPMTPDMERALKQLSNIQAGESLAALQYQTRVLELIYLLFSRIIHRDTPSRTQLIKADVDRLYELRDHLMADLGEVPNLSALARRVGMSPTKMKALYKIIFGESIYQYFQKARMNEAARLLRFHAVSEVAYKLGFKNLSHFGRLFEKHFHLKPKRFKDTLEGLPAVVTRSDGDA